MVREVTPEVAYETRALTGEGPLWFRGALWWVDIPSNTVHRTTPDGRDESFTLSKAVTALAPRASGGLVAAVEDGFAHLDPETLELDMLAPVEADDPRTRMNDGKCDPQGRFWAGTMAHDFSLHPDAGSLYRLGPDGSVTRVLEGVGISNGLGWSPDGETMYYIDSLRFRVDAFPADRVPAERRTLIRLPSGGEKLVAPDGMCVDADGCLWVALWGGGAVHCYSPTGEMLARVELPVSRPTSCSFGGEAWDLLYITTAAEGLTDEELEREPLAGSLFVCRPGPRGRPPDVFAG